MTPQTAIAHYRVTSKLGEGGMGEVWRATDTKLNREVAIKILPDSFANDPDRLARFTREAQVLASLNHPNIAAIYGVEERALIMELVEGETLHGPLPLATTVDYARQIAEALEYAHEKGIVHRDLKPANIKVTSEGRIKLLDFGLAKALSGEAAVADPASSPTMTMRATLAGVIMGTAAYMSPEQAHGRDADRRADIWSFGVVSFELLTGKMAFTGESISDTLGSVLKFEPDWNALPTDTPTSLRRLLRQCLRKDRRRRLQAIGDARIALEELAAEPEAETAPQLAAATPARTPWAVAAAALLMASVLAVSLWRATRPVEHPLMQFSADLGPDSIADFLKPPVLSPDGSRLAFSTRGPGGQPRLSVRMLSQPQAVPVSGTEGAAYPFFSPDGQWIGFSADDKLKKVPVSGGAATVVCEVRDRRGASWGEDGIVIVGTSAGLARVPAGGGTLEPLTNPSDRQERSHRWPQILPGGQAVLFSANTTPLGFDDALIEVLDLKTRQLKTVLRGGYFGRYLPSGHLVYVHNGALYGVPFDLGRLETRGTPQLLLSDITANPLTGSAQFDVSRNGTLVYFSGGSLGDNRTIAWLDRTGKIEPVFTTTGNYRDPHLSPDGKSLAFADAGGNGLDVSIYDLARQNTTRLTFNGAGRQPLWAPDARHIVYDSTKPVNALWWVRADGAREPVKLIEEKSPVIAYSFSPDGRRVAYSVMTPSLTAGNIWTLPLDTSDPERPKPGKPELFLSSPGLSASPSFSPDGRWIAYESDESGRIELYVRPFPGPGGKWLVSAGQGVHSHVWSRDGRELVYGTLGGRIMIAAVTAKDDAFVPEKPRLWPGPPSEDTTSFSTFDLTPDGKRLVYFPSPQAADDNKGVHATFLLNFFDDLGRKAPVK